MKALLISALCLAALLAAGAVQASCIYNKAYSPIKVELLCGTACQNDWIIHVDEHACRPGKGGTVRVLVLNATSENVVSDHRCDVQVDKHGWVSVYQDGKRITVTSKHSDGSHREECHAEITGSQR